MKIRNLITAAAIAVLPLAMNAATLVVPAAGTGAGANDSHWQSELTLHTSAPRAVTLSITFHQGTSVAGPVEVTVNANETVSIADVVKTKFGVESGSGALVIEVADRDAKSIAVTSRTSNVSPAGEFGQDVPAFAVDAAAVTGDVVALNGPSAAATSRFNVGLYATAATSVQWDLVRANGTVAATKTVDYAAGEHKQYGFAVASLFDKLPSEAADNDTIHARVKSGRAIFYGSSVNATGDPTFVPGIRTRDDIMINFAGIDLDENGTVDIADADHDGVLDQRIEIVASLFPAYFNVIASGEFGEAVTLSIVSASAPTDILEGKTLRVTAAGDVKGQTGEIVVKGTSNGSTGTLVIPVLFK